MRRLGLAWLEVRSDELRFRSPRRRIRTIAREDMCEVEYRRAWLLLPADAEFLRTELHFKVRALLFDTQRFLPIRPHAVLRSLRENGWPVAPGPDRCLWTRRGNTYRDWEDS